MVRDTDIAVVGVGCRFPDAWTPRQFWRNIDTGRVSMQPLDPDEVAGAGFTAADRDSPQLVATATSLPGVDQFAADFFGYSPREAETIDPQQRVFLEAAWEALEAAGHPPGAGPVLGVFAASAAGNYSAALFAAHVREHGIRSAIDDLHLTIGGQPDFLPSRLAYKLGARGPAVSVQTACSSSLYAVHYATLSLLAGECDIALAGGATVIEPFRGHVYKPGETLSDDGLCRSFDASSSGTAYSSGVGVVVLRRLADALADGDPVLAVLRGSAVGNDGQERMGYVAPSPTGIAEVIAGALRRAEVPAEQIRYVAAHGTATAIGDEIELLALTEAFRRDTAQTGYCGLGSVMTNIGHTGPVAGIASFIKAVHVAGSGTIPPHPLFERPRDPGVFAESPFYVTTVPRDCPDPDRHVLVNSFGVGGTNAVAVLGAPPAPTRPAAPERPVVQLLLSARTRAELDQRSRDLADALADGTTPAGDVAYTLRVGRQDFDERRVVTAPAHGLAAALRLPRPPAARTARVTPRRAVLVLPADPPTPAGEPAGPPSGPLGGPPDGPPGRLVDALLAALPDRTTTVAGPLDAVPANRFAIVLPGAEAAAGPNRHLIPAGAEPAEAARDAATAAWLDGVTVDWETLSGGAGRRVPLPTYPFTRKRFWALDIQPLADPTGARPAVATTAATPAAPPEAEPADGSLEARLRELWRRVFGIDEIGLDDQFAALGGSSMLSVQLVLDIQREHGVLVNFQRAGGSQATIRRIAAIIRGLRGDTPPGPESHDGQQYGAVGEDSALVDADLQLALEPLAAAQAGGPAPATDVLLTGATGFLGAFLLDELVRGTAGRVYCVVRAADEAAGLRRLAETAAKYRLPAPDPDRVCVVPADLRDIAAACTAYRGGELAGRIRHVVHPAARVVFTEPYRVLREDNVLPLAGLLNWMRRHGIRDLSYVSSLVATGPVVGGDGRILERRDQPLDPNLDAYGIGKWVCERLLERADADGMRIRVFRPGLIMADRRSGACNDKDLIWLTLASGLAVGAHPTDERMHPVAPVDVVAKAIVELGQAAGSVGRVYHLVDERSVPLRSLFEALARAAGTPSKPLPYGEWQQLVSGESSRRRSPVLAATALLELEGDDRPEDSIVARGWLPWLRRRNLSAAVDGEQLYRAVVHLAGRSPEFAAILPGLAAPDIPVGDRQPLGAAR
jgi:phthiocerol/phenolphthiocerol synthesis type-I polyketide synthase E